MAEHGKNPADPVGRAPAPLVAAASVVALQGLFTVLFGIAEIVSTSRERLVMGGTTSAFFILYGGVLLAGAWALNRCRTWARGPVFMAQLIWLGLAWNFRDAEQAGLRVLAGVVALLAVVVIAGLVHPASTDALVRDEDR